MDVLNKLFEKLNLGKIFSFFKLQTTPLVGIDISSSSVKILELSRIKNKYRVETYGIELLPPQTITEQNIKVVSEVTGTLKKLIERVGVNRKFASVAASGSSVLTRIIQVNAEFKNHQILEQIEVESDKYIPYPLEDVYFDFEVIGPNQTNLGQIDVLLVAARLETIETRVAAISEAGLQVTIIDMEALAMERAFSLLAAQLPLEEQDHNIALIDVGATNTAIYVFQEGRTIYNRDQAFGGMHLTDEIRKRYGLSVEEAVAAQKSGGLPEDYITEVLEPFKATVVQQISRAFQVFFSSSEESKIHHIILAGGGGNASRVGCQYSEGFKY